MFIFRRTLATTGARATIPLAVMALVLAVGAIMASSAAASPMCEGANIKGKGASLQKKSQEIWTGHLAASPFTTSGTGYDEVCGASPTVTYESTGSGPGLTAFRFNGAGEINHEYQYIGSDDAPTAAQITHGQEVAGTAKAVIIPVTQTAISVMVNLPSGCTITGGITWLDLNKVFAGKEITKWSQLSTKKEAKAGDCEKTISRVVRSEGSGTTYQFKNYLSVLETTTGITAAGPGCGLGTWASLRAIEGEEKPNITWPECEGTTTVLRAAGGGGVAAKVAETANTIGYAALPDAKGKGAATVSLQNGEPLGKTYGAPDNTTNSTARCTAASTYEVPEGGRKGVGSGESVDWSNVFGAKPKIGGANYPLCALTYDIAWTDYAQAGYGGESENYEKAVNDYLSSYVTESATGQGQEDIKGNWYSELPSSGEPGSANNVLDAAKFAASRVSQKLSKFHTDWDPAILTAEQTDTFTFNNGGPQCTGESEATTTNTTTVTLAFPLSYEAACVGGTVKNNGCEYRIRANGGFDIVCSGGNKIEFTMGTCTVKVPGQSGKTGALFANNGVTTGEKDVTVTGTIEKLNYEEVGGTCATPGAQTNGILHLNWTIKAYKDEGGTEGAQVGFLVT